MPCLRATSKQKDDRTTVYCRTTRKAAQIVVSGVKNEHAKQDNFSSVVLKINNNQEESVSSAVYQI